MKRILLTLTLLILLAPLCQAAPPQTRIVCKSSAECDYTEPADAVDSITDSAADKPYTVVVYPGIYTKAITMKSYIGIVGFDRASTIILGNVDGLGNPTYNAVLIPNGVTGTSFRGLTVGNAKPFTFGTQLENPPITTSVEDSTVGIFAGPVQATNSIDCWFDNSGNGGGHHISASNVTLNVSADCILLTKSSRFIGRNLTVFTAATGSTAFIRPGGTLTGGWTLDIDGIQHVSNLTSGVDYLFYWPIASMTNGGPVLKIRNAVWSVTTSGTVAKTQACVNLAAAAVVSSTADFQFTNVDCSLSATDASQTLYGFTIGNDADLANYRVHVQGGSITTSGPGTKADVNQGATASGFVFEMGSVRNGGTFVGAGTVSAITYHP